MTFWRLFVFISCWIWFTLVSAESFSFPPLRNLQAFNTLVLGNVPLFQTETILTAPEIILHPNANEINKMCVHCIRNCVEITKVRAHLRLSTGGSCPRCLGHQPRWQVAEEAESVGSSVSLAQTGLASHWLFPVGLYTLGRPKACPWCPLLLSPLLSVRSRPTPWLQHRPISVCSPDLSPTHRTFLVSCLPAVSPGTLDWACPRGASCPGFPYVGKWHQLNPETEAPSSASLLLSSPHTGSCPPLRPPLSFSMSPVFPGCRHPSPGLFLYCFYNPFSTTGQNGIFF